MVEPGRPDRAVHARAARPDPVGERLAVRAAGDVGDRRAALRAAGRAVAGGAAPRGRRPARAACWRRAGRRRPAPPPGGARALDPLLERVVTHLVSAMGRAFARTDPDESVALARLACAVGDDVPNAHVFAAVLELLDHYAEHRDVAADARAAPTRRRAASSSPRWPSRARRTCRCPSRGSPPRAPRPSARPAPDLSPRRRRPPLVGGGGRVRRAVRVHAAALEPLAAERLGRRGHAGRR